MRGILDRANVGLEHEVELARRRELAATLGADGSLHVIGAEPLLARLAVDERVREAGDVTGRFPHAGMHDDRRVEPDHVVAAGHHGTPPGVLHVAFELDAEWAIVETRTEATVDLAPRKHESPAFTEIHDLFHRGGRHGRKRKP